MDRLRQLGIDPFPAASFPTTHTTVQAAEAFEANPEDETLTKVRLAGRLMQRRLMGKAAFVELQDGAGRVQLYCSKDDLATETFPDFFGEVFKPLIDRGDFIGVEGFMFRTKMGEVTLHVKSLTLLGKSLRPLPLPKEKDGEVYDAFTDPEQRYRQRYVDLIVNPQVRETFRKRAVIIETMRRFFVEQGFLEVETPILQPLYGGAAARPFTTHHNTLDMKLYLRIANELYLKRLIVGGFDGVFEFAKDFRNEGMSRFHNPEFTMLELYAAYKDYAWMADFIEEALERVAIAVHGSTDVPVGDSGDKTISFARPWKRVTLYGAIEEATGVDVSELDEAGIATICRTHNIAVDSTMGRGKLIDELFGALVEPHCIQPTFVMDYPVELSPLAKRHADRPELTERFEVMCNGKEILNAFSELNDPVDQRRRFEEQLELGRRGDTESMVLDEDFLRALEFGMPPTAGIGIGIDRLCMIMLNQPSIQEVLLFPQMRAEKHDHHDHPQAEA